ncbi:MAG TPA: putative porin [Pyrinomonadaceae bacterium]|jgi:TolA-binding protein
MKQLHLRALAMCALFPLLASAVVFGQSTPAPRPKQDADKMNATAMASNDAPANTQAVRSNADAGRAAPDANDVQRQLREQREEIERLRKTVEEQMRLVEELRVRVERSETAGGSQTANASQTANGSQTATALQAGAVTQRAVLFKDSLPGVAEAQNPPTGGTQTTTDPQTGKPDDPLKRVEEQTKRTSEAIARQLGSITFSGDLRLRYEAIYGQLNAQPNADNPAILGNPLSSRNRLRLRARLGMRGQISKEFDWGLRLATGTYPDVNSTNQTLTDFFSHKNFALDHAYLNYKPSAVPGLQIQGGKFEAPWLRTEMTFDNDVSTEGLNENYTRSFKNSALKNLTFIAWQLPFLERASAFVLGSNGQVDFEQSRRQGRDLALYGAQLRARFEPSTKFGLTLSAADLYYSGTQFITPAQFFGSSVQIPVTVRIPATGTTPAQTVVAQVSIPRDQLISGSSLGIVSASNNAINRDGRLSSGYNLVDLIGRADFTHSKRWPVMLLFNYVVNTQAHDVVTAGAGGLDVLLENDENQGYWAEVQVGKTQQRGDWLFNYTYMRIEKDAVLTPFNFSDIAQQSDVRAQRFIVTYAADPRVTLSVTGIVTSRPNGLLGAFGLTPPGSLNRPTTRLQFDTNFRF